MLLINLKQTFLSQVKTIKREQRVCVGAAFIISVAHCSIHTHKQACDRTSPCSYRITLASIQLFNSQRVYSFRPRVSDNALHLLSQVRNRKLQCELIRAETVWFLVMMMKRITNKPVWRVSAAVEIRMNSVSITNLGSKEDFSVDERLSKCPQTKQLVTNVCIMVTRKLEGKCLTICFKMPSDTCMLFTVVHSYCTYGTLRVR